MVLILLCFFIPVFGTQPPVQWQLLETEHFYLLLPQGIQSPSYVADEVERIRNQVVGFWLPSGEELLEKARKGREEEMISSSPPQSGPQKSPLPHGPLKTLLLLYPDIETYWADTGAFGTGGLIKTWSSPWGLSELIHNPDSLDPVFQELYHEGRLWEDWFVAACCLNDCCGCGGWRSALAHELTHDLQFQIGWTGPHFVLEGMAYWTGFQLGYEQHFDLRINQEVAIWLEEGGGIGQEIPPYLIAEVGASLVDFFCSIGDKEDFLTIYSELVFSHRDLPEDMTQEELIIRRFGEPEEELLAEWKQSIRQVPISTGARVLYRAKQQELVERAVFLLPLFSPEQREEVCSRLASINAGQGTPADLERLEALFQGPFPPPDEAALSKIDQRLTWLRTIVENLVGSEATARVSRLNILRFRDLERLIQEYVDIVNTYLTGDILPHGS